MPRSLAAFNSRPLAVPYEQGDVVKLATIQRALSSNPWVEARDKSRCISGRYLTDGGAFFAVKFGRWTIVFERVDFATYAKACGTFCIDNEGSDYGRVVLVIPGAR